MDDASDEASLHTTATTTAMHPHTAFTYTTSPSDSPLSAHLAPSNLPISRIARAWDRKPQSPFSRKKVRLGKVWKRSGNALNHSASSAMFGGASGVFEAMGVESPVRAVKKMRTDVGELVNAWEGRGSPTNRRIVTRGRRSVEELIALEEEEEAVTIQQEAQEAVLNVEIVNDDGTVEQVEDETALADEEWEDESVAEECGADGDASTNQDQDEIAINVDSTTEAQAEPENREEASLDGPAVRSRTEHALGGPIPATTVLPPPQSTTIPEGFVSPVKERRRRPISQVKQANANRRKTLPTIFASQQANAYSTAEETVSHAQEQPEPVPVREMQVEQEAIEEATDVGTLNEKESSFEAIVSEDRSSTEPHTGYAQDRGWEDVEGDAASPLTAREATPEPTEQSGWIDTVENTPSSEEEAVQDAIRYTSQIRERLNALGSPSKPSSSPVPTISGQHPRLPLRRSPTRQSTTPLKKSSLFASNKPHLIAFTPVKMPVYRQTEADDPFRSSPLPGSAASVSARLDEMELPQITRSSSAPPEEPQMSPQKPKQPRISDDTALLQAFLKRATESKSVTNMSATARRESFENRRNSDTVRQALASPVANVAPVEVLADRHPNSPSPRKRNILTEAEDQKLCTQQEDDIEFDPMSRKRTSRRSGRSNKTSQQQLQATTFSQPNKITVRGSQDPIVLKKTEAQELAYLTKTNTRKNKGGSVLPPLKLTRMAKDGALEELPAADATAMDVEQPGRKGVKWAETLVSFYEGGNEPEESTMMDELNAPEPVPETVSVADQEMTAAPAVPAPNEMPIKPKLRRLKPPRTASTPGKATPIDDPLAQAEQAKVSKPKAPSTTKRKLRLATPAKPRDGVTTAIVDPSKEEEPALKPVISKPGTEGASIPKRKPTSRLPPPGSIAKPLAQGKENSLTASPPKKRGKAPAAADTKGVPSVKAFAPNLNFKSSMDAPTVGVPSPAKRMARGNFFAGGLGEVEGSAVKGRQEVPPSLGSPAKKRSRRVAG